MTTYPAGLKPGDFIQASKHFGDIFFEVITCWIDEASGYWHITYVTYPKYSGNMITDWLNSASTVRRVIPAEMAEPVMMHKGLRWHSTRGQYDPLYGYAPRGTPLRNRSDPW